MPVQWYTVQGGSKTYVTKVVEELKKSGVKFESGASKVVRNEAIEITSFDNIIKSFDKVVFACHSDEAIKLLDNPTDDENTLIGVIKYQPNRVILHTDKNIMPKRKKAWSSWNYLSKDLDDSRKVVSLSYWMNNLQPLNTSTDYFVTVNPDQKPDTSKIINEHDFSHPVFDKKAIDAQA